MTLVYTDAPEFHATARRASGYLPRSAWTPVWFAAPTLLCFLSWAAGGVSLLTDFGFIALAAICFGGTVNEMVRFPRRFGLGGLIFFAGALIWICHDYFDNWLFYNFQKPEAYLPAAVVAKAAFGHCLFLMMMAWGLVLPGGRWLERVIHAVPEPTSRSFYLWMVLLSFAVGLAPYLFFTREPWYEAIWLSIVSGRSGGPTWIYGRTGNVNHSWGAYLAVLIEIGQVGGQLAAFYAILIARSLAPRLLAFAIWAFWLVMAFGTGSRGNVVFMALPLVALMFLKYQSEAAVLFRRLDKKAYVVCGGVMLLVLLLVQIQAYYRDVGFGDVDVTSAQLGGLRGNTMFSEGLVGWQQIPSRHRPYFYDSFPGEAIVRPIPDTIVQFLIGPIPRALWTGKPVDPVWAWYNAAYLGTDEGTTGTTISQGMVGYWFFRYGFFGVLEGGVLLGWLLAVGERALQNARGMPMRVLFSLAFLTWLFRCFRGLNFHDLYPMIIGGVALAAVIYLQRSSSRGAGR